MQYLFSQNIADLLYLVEYTDRRTTIYVGRMCHENDPP